MKVDLKPLHDGDVLYVARNMRQADRDEIYATRRAESANNLVNDVMWASKQPDAFSVMACLGERPVAILGGVPFWPGVYDVWAFGTDEFHLVAFSLTKHIRRVMIPRLVERGCHRAHCRSLASHTVAHEWLRSFGFRPGLTLKAWGKNREDFLLFEWHLEDFMKEAV